MAGETSWRAQEAQNRDSWSRYTGASLGVKSGTDTNHRVDHKTDERVDHSGDRRSDFRPDRRGAREPRDRDERPDHRASRDAHVVIAPAEDVEFPPLHKDFYLRHPDPMFQCDEFFWGNLEAAHPVLGVRAWDDVEEYRKEGGIEVHTVRGRPAPKPFQSFSETSFPEFVEKLAYELFSEKAEPFPVQAQVWPCALAGADVTAIAPTGSGKTLAFLLPAVVHMMAQEPLQHGDGPIALVIVPTRELAQQTLAIANRFCSKTSGEDLLRAGAVYGGVDPSIQLPMDDIPDFGRWPELLIATPGRILELLCKRRWISPRRISYVVLDEADSLLSPRGWLPQIRTTLSFLRPDRQLLLLAATWPKEAETAAVELCGSELVRVRVAPAVPPIPQELRLFPETEGERSLQERQTALVTWVGAELAPEESVLVLCQNSRTARDIAMNDDLAVSAGGTGGFHPQFRVDGPVTLLEGSNEERRLAYWRFVRGEARVLVASFALGSRGLDYADTASGTAGQSGPPPLNLVVLLFDFPPTIKEYAHCIGRTTRPGHCGGRAVVFVPEMRFWVAKELADLMEHCGQKVPEALSGLINEDQTFLNDAREAMVRLKDGQAPCAEDVDLATMEGSTGAHRRPAFCGGDFDAQRGVWRLPAKLPSYRRKLLHWLADELGLPHVSAGEQPNRHYHVALSREALPDKFFIEGEMVLVWNHRSGMEREAVVVDPRVHRRNRMLRVKYAGDVDEMEVPVDAVRVPDDPN